MSIYEQLGVVPIINAKGTYTMLSGSLMLPEVVEAMAEASRCFVNMAELEARVGERLAELTGAEFGHVTSGAAAALTQSTAACMVGKDEALRKQLPDVSGLKHEVLIQEQHRCPYDQAVVTTGARLVEVDGEEELVGRIREQTAMLLYVNAFDAKGKVKLSRFLEIGKAHGIPVMVDAAAELPPAENLTRFIRRGVDLVCFSGGKGLRGPQSSGLLLGRRDLVEAAALNGCPHHSIGRPMKAGKEEIIGLLTAVESYARRDHEAEWARWEAQIAHIAGELADLPHVNTGSIPEEMLNHVPRVYAEFDEQVVGKTQAEVVAALRQGTPRIEVLETAKGITISPNTLQPGDEQKVARRLHELLRAN